MAKPNTLILTGYGINCDEETSFAFEKSGADTEIVHINDLIDGHRRLADYQILAFPGGFSYGDDTGSGKALANKIRNHLWEEVQEFVEDDKLVIGICNGFQVITNLGLLPGMDGNYGNREVALDHNESARYDVRWVDLEFIADSPWTKDIDRMSVPIAHGEGRFYASDSTLRKLKKKNLVSSKYVEGETCNYQLLPANPNGSIDDIAGIVDESGRIMGMMPHPERAIDFTQLPDWPLRRERLRREGEPVTEYGPGLKIFQNGVNYFE